MEHGGVIHYRGLVYVKTMLLQICADYSSLPDIRSLTLGEIKFFYRGLTSSLIELTKPKRSK